MISHTEYKRLIGCPDYVRNEAVKSNRKILKIIWDREDGYPEHAWGYIQWSVRPYRLSDGCDGTRDGCAHFLAKHFLESINLNYFDIYDLAYFDDDREPTDMREFPDSYWNEVAKEVEIPEVNKRNFRKLLDDLYDMNHRSIVALLEEMIDEGKIQFQGDF